MNTPTAFPTWRTSWTALDGTPPLLANADALLRRRARGNHLLPKWDVTLTAELRASLELEALRRWTDGEPPDVSKRPWIATRIYEVLAPALWTAAWPRWLFLERAFFDGSNTGDLLFSALAVRTMCEEVQRLRCVDLDATEIAELATASEGTTEYARLMAFLRMVRASLDAPGDPRHFDYASCSDGEFTFSASPRLRSAKQALNDYVHPNYGSHIAALYPERTEAARILLEGLIAAYDEFFALSWAEEPIAGPGISLDVAPLKSWPQTVRQFTRVFNARATVAWLTTKHTDAREMLNEPEISGLVDSLRLSGDTARSKTLEHESGRHRLWEGASERDVLFIALARCVEQRLTEEFPGGAPENSEQQRWLRFVALELQLAVKLYEIKVSSFKAQLARQTVSGNPLGILLCMRSLLEQKAIAVWLVNCLESLWAETGKRVKPADNLPLQAKNFEEALARFLAGTKGTAEGERPWAARMGSLSLPDKLKSAFKSADQFRLFYDIASSALHGRIYSGLDLLAQTSAIPSFQR
jgi:hypothetical protein